MEKEEVRKIIQDNIRNQIELDIKENNDGVAVISSKIGGKPSVPADFEWPKYHAKWFEEGESRPLTFWAQFNLEEVSKYDKDGILPKKGILSFFYCLTEDELFWGTNPSEKGSARIYYFEDVSSLVEAEFPEDLSDEFTISEKAVTFKENISYPTSEYLCEKYRTCPWNEYHECMEETGYFELPLCHDKLLGHSEFVQHCSEYLCEVVHRGYNADFPNGREFSDEEEKLILGELDNWVHLYQLDPSFAPYDYKLGVDGTIHFYIKREDLQALNFDNIEYILDCS